MLSIICLPGKFSKPKKGGNRVLFRALKACARAYSAAMTISGDPS